MLRTSALALTLALTGAAPAIADQHMAGEPGMNSGRVTDSVMENLIRTSDITGADIYVMDVDYDEAEWMENDWFDEIGEGWEDAGDVSDVVLSMDGKLAGIVVEHGGFLDIGDDHSLVSLQDVKMVRSDGMEMAFVTRLTEEQLENLPEVGESWW